MSQRQQPGNHPLHTIYRDIQRQRDERLAEILRVLDQKAATDPEIAHVTQLLRLWTSAERREHAASQVRTDKAP